jgi:hypothetical protein
MLKTLLREVGYDIEEGELRDDDIRPTSPFSRPGQHLAGQLRLAEMQLLLGMEVVEEPNRRSQNGHKNEKPQTTLKEYHEQNNCL